MIFVSGAAQPPDTSRSHESMELERALEILGLAPGAAAAEIESAYRRLRDDLDTRVARVQAGALRAHLASLRQLLDPARDAALAALSGEGARSSDKRGDAFATLGLSAGASALDVASAYVTLCDELEREVAAAPTEGLRRACLAARAEIDAAYQRCAAQPLRAAEGLESASSTSGRYETYLADDPFEAAPDPTRSASPLGVAPAVGGTRARRSREKPRRRRRRLAFAFAFAFACFALLVGGIVAIGPEALRREASRVLVRFANAGPPAELTEAQTAAEYLRRRVGDERRELQARVEENRARVTRLEEEWTSAHDPADYDRMAVEIGRARARAELTEEIAVLAENHVFAGADVAVAYGKIELGNELVAAGDAEEATAAFEAAWLGLEQALARLDLAEEAVGARSEAQAALEAWEGLARSGGLEESEPARQGREVLARGRQLLEAGSFAEAVPELRVAARHLAAAVGDGRKLVTEARASALAEASASDAGAGQNDSASRAPGNAPEAQPVAEPSDAPAASPGPPPVAAPPPNSARERVRVNVGWAADEASSRGVPGDGD